MRTCGQCAGRATLARVPTENFSVEVYMSWTMTAQVKHIRSGVNGEPITVSQKLILMLLADSHNEDFGFAWPKIERLAEDSLLDERSVQRCIGHLESCGLLSVEKGGGRGNPSKYFVLPNGVADVTVSERVTFDGEERVTPDAILENVSINEPIEGKPEPIGELPLAKPKKKEKVKGFKNRRPARSLNDFPDTVHDLSGSHPAHATISDMPPGDVAQVWTEKIIGELWKEMRKAFRRKIGKSPGNLFGRSLDAMRQGIEKHGTSLVEKTFGEWIEQLSERDVRYMKDNPHMMGFTLHIDEWIEEFQVQPEANEPRDPNAGLGLSEKGKEKLGIFDRTA